MIRTAKTTRRTTAFSLTDLLVVIVVIAAMLAVQLPTDAAARRTARQMQNSVQLRGIHQALVTHANSQKERFAGLNSKGQILKDGERTTGNSGDGNTIQARYWIMLRGEFFTPDYAVSPNETADIDPVDYDGWDDDTVPTVKWDERDKNYSYAMLGFRKGRANNGQPPSFAVNADDAPRAAEWRQTLNSQAVVLSDRNAGDNATNQVESIHSGERGEWRGGVLWNDNHVGFESEQYLETKYANGALNRNPLDNLFDDRQANDQPRGANALMVIAGETTVHGGE